MITRSDLKPGYQSVQSGHAAIQYIFDHPECAKNWFETSNYLCFLSVNNEQELVRLIEQATDIGIKFSIFKEPDINYQITAIALEPGEKSRELCSELKLALRDL